MLKNIVSKKALAHLEAIMMMTKTKRSTIATILFVTLILAIIPITAHAATATELTGSYKTVYRKNSNATYYVWLDVTNTRKDQHTDVRMLDKNMNVIWEEYGAVDYSTKRQFVCGPDVCYIQARVGAKFISGELYGKFAECYAYE